MTTPSQVREATRVLADHQHVPGDWLVCKCGYNWNLIHQARELDKTGLLRVKRTSNNIGRWLVWRGPNHHKWLVTQYTSETGVRAAVLFQTWQYAMDFVNMRIGQGWTDAYHADDR
jgi:hypothetical protein